MLSADLLLLRFPSYSTQITAFFQRIQNEPSLTQMFARNPVGVLRQLVLPTEPQLSSDVLSRENRLLFSLLSNRGFRDWANRYQRDFENRATQLYPDFTREEAFKALAVQTPREEIYRSAAEAAASFVDRDILYSMIENHSVVLAPHAEAALIPSPAAAPVFIILVVVLLVAGVYTVIPVDGLESDGLRLDGLSRVDLKRISGGLLDALQNHAEMLKTEGKLFPSSGS